MNARTGRRLWLTLLILVLTAGCAGLGPQPLPTQPPGIVETIIAATFSVAQAQTQAAMPANTQPAIPTDTQTPLPTPTITDTPFTPTVTLTPTPWWYYASPTPFATMTQMRRPATGGGSTGGGSYTTKAPAPTPVQLKCYFISQNPLNNTTLKPGQDFDAIWRVENNGKIAWTYTDTDLIYVSGQKMQKFYDIIDIPHTVKVGEQLEWVVDMTAPAAAGTYTTNWKMTLGIYSFCPVSLTIRVVP